MRARHFNQHISLYCVAFPGPNNRIGFIAKFVLSELRPISNNFANNDSVVLQNYIEIDICIHIYIQRQPCQIQNGAALTIKVKVRINTDGAYRMILYIILCMYIGTSGIYEVYSKLFCGNIGIRSSKLSKNVSKIICNYTIFKN